MRESTSISWNYLMCLCLITSACRSGPPKLDSYKRIGVILAEVTSEKQIVRSVNLIDGNQSTLLYRAAPGVLLGSLAWAPDRKHLYFTERDFEQHVSAVKELTNNGSKWSVRTLLSDSILEYTAMSCARSTGELAIAVFRRTPLRSFLRVSNRGFWTDVGETPGKIYQSISWSNDGKRLLTSIQDSSLEYASELLVLNAGTGEVERRWLTEHEYIIGDVAWCQQNPSLVCFSGLKEKSFRPHKLEEIRAYVFQIGDSTPTAIINPGGDAKWWGGSELLVASGSLENRELDVVDMQSLSSLRVSQLKVLEIAENPR